MAIANRTPSGPHAYKKLISLALLEKGLLSHEQLDKAMEEVNSQGQPTSFLDLLQQGAVSPADYLEVLGQVFDLPVVQLQNEEVAPEALALVPESLAHRYNVLPLRIQSDELLVVTADPLNIQATEDLKAHTRRRIRLALATAGELQEAIKAHYRTTQAFERDIDWLVATSATEAAVADQALLETANQTPIVRTVDSLLLQAVKDRASDIHIQAQQKQVVIRYRIDGILHQILSLPRALTRR